MLRLNQQFVQAWPEERIGSIILINHMWRTQEEIKKYGFNLYYQTVTVKQYELLISLESTLSNQLYNETIAQLGTYLVNKLEKHMFLIDERKKSINTQPIWFSQAAHYLYKYLRQRYKLLYPERPSRVILLPTLRCYGNCIFCITNSSMNMPQDELESTMWGDITARVMTEWSPSNIDIIGGEPLLRMDSVIEILKITSQTNCVVKLVTNGELLNSQNVAYLKLYLSQCNHNIQISLDGTEPSFSKIRTNVNYNKVLMGISNVSSAGLNFGINMTICRYNLESLEETIRTLVPYGPRYITVGPLQISPKCTELCVDIVITEDEELELHNRLNYLACQYPDILFKYDKEIPPYQSGQNPLGNGKALHTCTGYFEEITIMPDGATAPCLRSTAFSDLIGPSVTNFQVSMASIWHEAPIAKAFRSIKVEGRCKECHYNQQCNMGCPLDNYIMSRKLGGENPFCTYNKGG